MCSIQLALLSVEEQHALAGNGHCTPLTSAQLRSRHWVIRHGTSATADVVEGDGVIGEYPLLTAGVCASTCRCCNIMPGDEFDRHRGRSVSAVETR